MTVLAGDMGGTTIKLGVVRDGHVLKEGTIPAHSDEGLEPRLPALVEAFRALCAATGIAPADCAGVSLAYPSIIEARTGRIMDQYGKYRDAMGLDLKAWARKKLGLPLAIDNDARMALIGEWRHGAGRGFDNVAMMTLGTGLGASAVMEGRVLRGAHGQAGIMGGHLTVQVGGRLCACGNIGCAEAESATGYLSRIVEEHGGLAGSALESEPVLDYAAIFRHAAQGDALATALRDHGLEVWSAAVVNLIHAYDPEIVILGGGIMASADVILDYVQGYVDRHAHTPWGRVRILPSELGSQAALVAGEWLVQEHQREGWLS